MKKSIFVIFLGFVLTGCGSNNFITKKSTADTKSTFYFKKDSCNIYDFVGTYQVTRCDGMMPNILRGEPEQIFIKERVGVVEYRYAHRALRPLLFAHRGDLNSEPNPIKISNNGCTIEQVFSRKFAWRAKEAVALQLIPGSNVIEVIANSYDKGRKNHVYRCAFIKRTR